MISIASELTAPFERMTPGDAAGLLAERYGIRASSLEQLDTAKDDSFHVRGDGVDFLLKVAHPDDDPIDVNLQTAAVAHAHDVDPGLPLQRILATIDGEIEPVVTGSDGRERVARVLSWLPGTLMFDAELNDAALEKFGVMQARLTLALADFRHPAAERRLPWDLAYLGDLRPLLEIAPDARTIERVLDDYADLRPMLAELPRQVLHNDLNPGNVVTDATHPDFVTGILDFADAITTNRIVDLAVSLSYLLPATGDPWGPLLAVIRGYHSRIRIGVAEADALPALVNARLAQRILVATWLGRNSPDDRDYLWRNIANNQAQLAAATVTDPSVIRRRIREATGS